MKRAWVYILECSDRTYYTGCTTNIEQRISQHQQGTYPGYTSTRHPVTLRWSQEFPDIRYAIWAERQIKGWSRRKKEALINEQFDLLRKFAQSKEMIERRSKRKQLSHRAQ
jgi:putative endonuclease